jgi:sugar transferase (PEP-CTERM/EpsH1 system associated)
MKILFLTSRFPYPAIGGDKLRAFNIIKYLAKQHEITALSLYEKSTDLNELANFKNYVYDVITFKIPPFFSYLKSFIGLFSTLPVQTHYYFSSKIKKFINEELKRQKYDLIFVHLIRMAEYVKDKSDYVKLIDLTDAISLNYERAKKYRQGIFRWVNLLESKRVRKYESETSNYFDTAFVISGVDKDYINSISENDNLEVLENGVDLDFFHPNDFSAPEERIIFLGNMRTFPNQDAAFYFANEIFPKLLQRLPDLHFYIIGVYPPKKILALNSQPNIHVTGFVDDVRPYIWSSIAAVSPMRVGAGLQNKILECMACGMPVITTSLGNEGINACNQKEIFIAEREEDYLKIILKLLESAQYREDIGKNARSFIEKKYRWDSVLSKLDEIISKVCYVK